MWDTLTLEFKVVNLSTGSASILRAGLDARILKKIIDRALDIQFQY